MDERAVAQTGIERRRFARADLYRPPTKGGDPSRPVLINLSVGGMCLFIRDLPTTDPPCGVRLRWDAQERVLPVRLVWMLEHGAPRSTDNVHRQAGWYAGLAFPSTSTDPGGSAIPWNIPPRTDIAVDLLQENDPAFPRVGERGGVSRPGLDPQAINHLKAATESLLPVLTRHCADIHLEVTRERLEVSATFRSLAELTSLEEAAPGWRAIQRNHASPVLAAPQAHRDPGAAQHTGDRPLARRRLLLSAAAGLLTVVLGLHFVPGLLRGERTSPGVKGPAQRRPVPVWAAKVNPTAREGWTDLQARFGLTDATVVSAIRLLKVSDKYPPGHRYGDLTVYPVEIARAFGILANSGAAGERDLGALTKDLGMKLVRGARFPDEPPGARHLPGSRDLTDGFVVLAVVEALYDHQNDPAVRDLLKALWQVSPGKGSDLST